MLIKGLVDEDFINYKKPSMFIVFPQCSFKCDKEARVHCCQNSALANSPSIEMDIGKIVERYINNPITSAIVCGGLEPFDSHIDLLSLLYLLRVEHNCIDDIVIYTGYNKEEIKEKLVPIQSYPNVIVKFGRFVPNQPKHYDKVLGVNLASNNQYAEKIS